MIEIVLFLLSMAMLQVRREERTSAAIFCFCTWAFYFIQFALTQEIYYYCAAAADVLICLWLWRYFKSTHDRLVKYLVALSGASIILNLYGLAHCIYSIPHPEYDEISYAIYIIAIILFLSRNKRIKYGVNDRHNRFLRDAAHSH